MALAPVSGSKPQPRKIEKKDPPKKVEQPKKKAASDATKAATAKRAEAGKAQETARRDERGARRAEATNKTAQKEKASAKGNLDTSKSRYQAALKNMDQRGPRPGDGERLKRLDKDVKGSQEKFDKASTEAAKTSKAAQEARTKADASQREATVKADAALRSEQKANAAAKAAGLKEPFREANGIKDSFEASKLSPQAQEKLFGTSVATMQRPADPGSSVSAAPADPAKRADWWKGLSSTEKSQAINSDPKKIGSMDGLPASVRDGANRLQLKNEITDLKAEAKREKQEYLDNVDNVPAGNPLRNKVIERGNDAPEKFLSSDKQKQLQNAEAVQKQLDKVGKEAGNAQLLVYDSKFAGGEGRAAIVAGNLDTARHVAVSVPGLGSDVRSYMDNVTNDALRLKAAAGERNKGDVAAVAWMGYDAPTFKNVASDNAAENGAKLLAKDVAGIRASRGENQPHLTVVGHSYGSTTTSIAADKHGLKADDMVLIGSPGAGSAKSVKDYDGKLADGHVWTGSASKDKVTWLNGENMPGDPLGKDPSEGRFGAKRFTAEAEDRGSFSNFGDHSKYYNKGSESLNNLADIVTGNYGGVDKADHRYSKPVVGGGNGWFRFPEINLSNRVVDPESGRRV